MSAPKTTTAGDSWSPVAERRRRSNSESAEAEVAPNRNAERRRRRRARAPADGARPTDGGKATDGAPTERDAEKGLKRCDKALRAIETLAAKARPTREEAAKVAKRDGLEAARAAFRAVLDTLAAGRAAADAALDALDAVAFDERYECATCREVLELPVALKCGHEFCRACACRIAARALRPADVACPLCRRSFYDGATGGCAVTVAAATRKRLKRVTGACHCGASIPLARLRDHLRGCGAPARYFADRPPLGHELCPPPDFAAAYALSKESDAAPAREATALDDALLRRYRVEPAAPQVPRPAAAAAAPPPPPPRHKARAKFRAFAAVREAPPPPPPPPPARPAWGAAAAAAAAPVDLRAVLAEPPRPARGGAAAPRADGAAPAAAAVPLAAFLKAAPRSPAPAAPWRGGAAPGASPTSVRDIVAAEGKAAERRRSTWAGVAR